MEHREPTQHRARADAPLQEAPDVDRRFELLARSHALVQARERGETIQVGLVAALAAEPLERLARSRKIADHLADPGLREHREAVDRGVAAAIALRHLDARGSRLLRAARHVVLERGLERE